MCSSDLDATWEYSTDGGNTWTDGTGTSFELPEGDYADDKVVVRQTDPAGNTSDNGELGAVIIDTTPPKFEITAITNHFDGEGKLDGTQIHGTAEPGITLEIIYLNYKYDPDTNPEVGREVVLGPVVTDEQGQFELFVKQWGDEDAYTGLLHEQSYAITATDLAGNSALASVRDRKSVV